MAFLALIVFEGSIGSLATLLMVVVTSCKMNKNILDTMKSLCIEEIDRIVRRREVAIHAVGYESLGIVHMSGRFPGIICKLNFMT